MQKNFTINGLRVAIPKARWNALITVIWKTMKFSMAQVTLTMVFSIMAMANANYAQKVLDREVYLTVRAEKLSKVLRVIETTAKVKFVYSRSHLKLEEEVSIESSGKTLAQVLEELLEPLEIQYRVQEKSEYILLTHEHQASGPARENAVADKDVFGPMQATVIGVVTSSEDGETIPGVNVIEKGTSNGTITDIDGRYSIDVAEGATLVFSSIGFMREEVPVDDRLVINVELKVDIQTLEEVVVVGYGEQRRSQMSTAVSKLDTKVLQSVPRSNPATALQGTVAGLSVQNVTGQPGATPQIVMRGGTEWEGTGSPLILIDGVISEFYALNTEDIASIEVLKDAAATAIYGARAANGVILVTTKKGKAGISQLTYKFKLGINNPYNTIDYLNARDFIYYNRIGVQNRIDITGDALDTWLTGSNAFATGNNTTDSPFTTMVLSEDNRYLLDFPGWKTMPDPLDPGTELIYMENDLSQLIYQDSNVKDHYLSFDGGNDKGNFSLGLGYMDDVGIVIGSGFKRYSGKLNANYKVKDNVNVGTNLLYTHANETPTYVEHTPTFNIFERHAGQPPTARIYNNNLDGSLSSEPNPGTNRGFGNPLYYADKFIRNNLNQRLTAGTFVDWDILPELRFSVQGSYFLTSNNARSFNKAYFDAGSINTERMSSVSSLRTIRNQYTATLNYSKTLMEDHNFSILAGGEYYNQNVFWMEAATKNSPTDLIPTMNAGSEALGVPSSTETGNRIISQFARVSYDYKMKYLVNLSVRRDGSSKLDSEKFGIFPGISFGWNAHNEDFYSSSFLATAVSSLKPRISYGVNGNIDVLSDFGVYGTYGNLGIYSGQVGYGNTLLPTPDLIWERSTTFNVGLDLGFSNDRVKLLLDYFVRDVHGKIAEQILPFWTGFNSILTNNGVLRNKGFEAELRADIVNSGNLRWNVGKTFYTFRNYVMELPENDNENNRQGGIQIYNPETGQVEWVGGLQEGKRVGNDEVYELQQEYVYADQAAVDEHANVVDTYHRAGLQQTRRPGDVAWLDVDKNDTIDFRDRRYVGRTRPSIMGGFTSNLSYKGFSLFMKFDYGLGHVIKNMVRMRGNRQSQGNQNSTTEVLESWTPENPNTDVPRFDFTDPQNNHERNGRYWEKGDYLCMREVTLSYDFVPAFARDYLKQFRLYVSGSNLHYFTKYSGNLPEIGGEDWGRYPLPRVYTLGLAATF